jgi:hypothetical protein
MGAAQNCASDIRLLDLYHKFVIAFKPKSGILLTWHSKGKYNSYPAG